MVFVRAIFVGLLRGSSTGSTTCHPTLCSFWAIATSTTFLLDHHLETLSENGDKCFEKFTVTVESFEDNFAAAFDIINQYLKAHCRDGRVARHCTTTVSKRQTLEEHLAQRERLFVHRSCNSLLHLDDLKFLGGGHSLENFENIVRGER